MSHFKMPAWARAPAQPGSASLFPADGGEEIDVSRKPAYALGRDPALADVALAAPGGQTPAALAALGVGRVHAAVVHHEDGRSYAIDLESRGGTTLDGKALEPNRPARLRDGSALAFGKLGRAYVYRCGGGGGGAGGGGGGVGGGSSAQHQQRHEPRPASVRASHLLIKHSGSRRPSSFREPVVTCSVDEAVRDVLRLSAEIRGRVSNGQERLEDVFAEVAERESHCSSAKRGGDLGVFGPGQMQRAFEEAAFALAVGEMSAQPLHSDSGVHLILRTG